MVKKIKEISNKKKAKEGKIKCKNCKTKFIGKYCPECGQSTYEYERPFKLLIVDFTGNVFAFDTRFWKTLGSLIIYPGKYAADYVKGHRARYMSPFRFYVFISFIFFLLLSTYLRKNVQISEETKYEINSSLHVELNSNSEEADSIKSYNSNFGAKNVSNKELANALVRLVNNPGLYMKSFLKIFSWSLFLLMPVYAGYLFLFFRKSIKYYYSHLIFAVNQHAFIFLIFIFLLALKLIFPLRDNHPENYLLWTIPIYMFIGYMQLYKRSWYATFFRLFSTLFLYTITLAVAIGIILIFWVNIEFL